MKKTTIAPVLKFDSAQITFAMSDDKLGQTAWDTYNLNVGGKAVNGDPLPTWEQLKADPKRTHIVTGWISAAQAAVVANAIAQARVAAAVAADVASIPRAANPEKPTRFITLDVATKCCGTKILTLTTGGYQCPCGGTFKSLQ